MRAIKNYGWAIKLVGAALLVGLSIFLKIKQDSGIVEGFIGSVMIIYSMVRLVPFVKTQKSDLIKTINIIEITVGVMMGLVLIIFPLTLDKPIDGLFSYILGSYLIIRGSVHFYSVSHGDEKSDLPLYLFHIAALIVGTYIFTTWGDFTPAVIINVILIFSIGSAAYLSYDGFNGYRQYRYQKQLHMPKEVADTKDKTVEKELPVTEEEPAQDHVVM